MFGTIVSYAAALIALVLFVLFVKTKIEAAKEKRELGVRSPFSGGGIKNPFYLKKK